MKKGLFLLLMLSSSFSVSAFASEAPKVNDTDVKIQGFYHFQSAFANQKNLVGNEKNLSSEKKGMTFYTEAALRAEVFHQTDTDLAYGARIAVVPTTLVKGGTSYGGSHIFLQSDYGKVEVGSPFDAGAKLRVTGYDVSAATGDDWTGFGHLDGVKMKYNGLAPDFLMHNAGFFDSSFRTDNGFNAKTEASRKVSFFTPKVNGFQVGISYIPEAGNNGGAKNDVVSIRESYSINTVSTDYNSNFVYSTNVKDAFAGGVSYEYNIADAVDVKLALTGEYGKPAGRLVETRTVPNASQTILKYKLSSLKTYNVGTILSYGNVSFGASYGDRGNSLTNKAYHKVGRNGKNYNGVVAYNQGPVNASVTYFKSNYYKNDLDAITLGTDFKLAPGLVPYAEVTYFTAKGKPVFYPEAKKTKTKGTVALIGAKLKF